jgi:ABC-type transport system involved in cytochrome c biogenesis permease subunit
LEGVSRFCFAASYAVALGLELIALARPRPLVRVAGLAFGAAGLFAHSAFLLYHRPTYAAAYGSLLLLAWVLAVFYLYGAVHHRRLAWAVFVLPVVLALVGLAGPINPGGLPKPYEPPEFLEPLRGEKFWGAVHGVLLLLSAVGVCVGFVASVMYLVQARRLRQKRPPLGGVRMLSLERLEAMNRRAVNLAFPLLTVGLVVGAALLAHRAEPAQTWTALKFLGAYGLWLVSAVLLYLRYGLHVRGRHLAFGTIAAFALMLATLAVAHPVAGGVP